MFYVVFFNADMELGISALFNLMSLNCWVNTCFQSMLLRLFKNVDGCVSDPPKNSVFLKIRRAATFLESPSNLAFNHGPHVLVG